VEKGGVSLAVRSDECDLRSVIAKTEKAERFRAVTGAAPLSFAIGRPRASTDAFTQDSRTIVGGLFF